MLITTKKDNVVIELYNTLGLLASKYIVLQIKKDTRDFSDFIDAELPHPSLIIETWDGYFISWAVKGKITTKAQKEFYKDLSLRLKKTLLKRTSLNRVENSSIWAIQYALKDGYIENNKIAYEMKYLASCCESLTSKEEKEKKLSNITTKEELSIFAGTYKKSEDALFDFIRFKAYDYKKINIINNIETKFEDLENYCLAIANLGYEIIGSSKGIGSLKSKAKNIAKWTFDNYQNGTKKKKDVSKELEMTRKENMTRINKLKAEDCRIKVKQAVEALSFLGEKISVRKVASYAKISTKTAQKYLKEFREKN